MMNGDMGYRSVTRRVPRTVASVRACLATVTIWVLLCTLATSASAAPPDQRSGNYAGYVAINGRYTHVLAEFQVPTVQCPVVLATPSGAGFWVGLGGGRSLQQAGVTTHCYNGVATYAAFYQIIPGHTDPQELNPAQYPVFPGDFIEVEIRFARPDKFDVRIRGGWWTFTTTLQLQDRVRDALRSAYFIAEAPGDKTLPLTDFGTVHFQNSFTNETPLTDLPDAVQRWIMVDGAGQLKAEPSPLTPFGGHGPAFDVKWISAGP